VEGFLYSVPVLFSDENNPRDFPVWHATIWQRLTASLAGLVIAHIVAWHKVYSKNKMLTTTSPRLVLADKPVDIAPVTSFDATAECGLETIWRFACDLAIGRKSTPTRQMQESMPLIFHRPEDNSPVLSMDGRSTKSIEPTLSRSLSDQRRKPR